MALEPASVVIPSWNGAHLLGPTLEHLAKLAGIDFEVIVVDHGRLNRDSEEVVQLCAARDPRVRYLGLDEQLGYAGAVNHGANAARNRLVAVLCNDVLVEIDWLAELVIRFGEREQQGRRPVVTSLVTRPGFDIALGSRMNLWGRIVRTGAPPARAEDYVPFFPDGSAFLFDKSLLGLPFDADYFLYQEDVSVGWRAWLNGEEVVLAPRSRALNADGGTTRKMPYRSAFFTERNRWLNYLSYFSFPTLLRVMPLLKIDALARLAAGSNRLARIHAWAWLIAHPGEVLRKRAARQSKRRRPDSEILPLISGRYLERDSPLNAIVRVYYRLVGLNLGA